MKKPRKGAGRKTRRITEADLAAMRANVSASIGGAPAAKARRSKYNAEPVYVGTLKFDSKREAARYQLLRQREIAGEITDLQLQVVFVLAPAVDIGEKRKKPAMRYKADFAYVEVATGERVVEDSKGFQTRAYRDRKHLMKSVHGITIREV